MSGFLKKLISTQRSLFRAKTAGTPTTSEYSVYIFYPNPNKNSGPKWRKVAATRCIKRAVKHAQILHKKKRYQRIEVKRHSYLKKLNRYECKTVRTYDKKRTSSWRNFMRSLSVSS